MAAMSAAQFEARYRDDPDPWGYTSSSYERQKYASTVAACGPGPFANGLELGASIGVFSELLAPRCRRLTTIDAAPTAVAAARERLSGRPEVQVLLGSIPADVPNGPYDLIVASEILYYLPAPELESTLDRLAGTLADGGRLVAVHWVPPGHERPFTAAQVHTKLRNEAWLEPRFAMATSQYLLDVLERR